MAATVEQLNALLSMRAQGLKRMRYKDREFEFRSLEELETAIRALRQELGLEPRGWTMDVVRHDKGYV